MAKDRIKAPIGGGITANTSKVKNATRQLKAEVSRKASMANKRLKRLEKNGLTNLPAYKEWVNYSGGLKFSVAGKSYNELQAELSRVNHFVNSTTSTVRGANKYMKGIAETVGLKYTRVGELQGKLSNFFEIVSKVEQYLENTQDVVSAIGYQKLWEVVNNYVKDEKINLNNAKEDIGDIIGDISSAVTNQYLTQFGDKINEYSNMTGYKGTQSGEVPLPDWLDLM